MAYIRGEAREQVTMFPVTLDELIPADHMCRVIEAFVATGDGKPGIRACGTGRDGPARLRSTRSVEAVSVRLQIATLAARDCQERGCGQLNRQS